MGPEKAWREDIGTLILKGTCDEVLEKEGVHSPVVACKESLLRYDLELGRGSRFLWKIYYFHIGSIEVEFIQNICVWEKSRKGHLRSHTESIQNLPVNP